MDVQQISLYRRYPPSRIPEGQNVSIVGMILQLDEGRKKMTLEIDSNLKRTIDVHFPQSFQCAQLRHVKFIEIRGLTTSLTEVMMKEYTDFKDNFGTYFDIQISKYIMKQYKLWRMEVLETYLDDDLLKQQRYLKQFNEYIKYILLSMIPFQKIFTLIIRTFSKPMLSLLKRKQNEKKFFYFAAFFRFIGRKYHSAEFWLNSRMLKTIKHTALPELKQQMQLEKGIEGFYEALFYLIVLGLPMYELYQGAQSSQKKEEALQKKIIKLEDRIKSISNKMNELIQLSGGKAKEGKQRRKLLTEQIKNKQNKQLQDKEKIENTDNTEIDKPNIVQNALQVLSDEFQDLFDAIQIGGTDVSFDADISFETDITDTSVQ